ncbi:MAG: DegT/DnrJ/EryC1/StrS family aminotransferase [Flavobacteriales bacterium]|nr:DegT/DnrJ/EryC1/StrS family aminotransferase [Flavobacteriales bacterium]MCB9165865.1 DegT/DnrJ/EryC1/StrS family aminotransferase [Flavobacteriales bacterium]
MVDLVGQYHRIKPEVDAAFARILESAGFIGGPEVKGFEQELSGHLGCQETIACANGTDAIQIALMALGLSPGDEVITTAFTFVATVEVVGLLGLTPVFADVDPETFLIDPEDIRRKITPRTKAIVPVHLFGQCADMGAIMAIAAEHGLHVVEDNAQAIGAAINMPDGTTRKAGTIGTVGTTSFFPSKNLGCYGDGGALFTNDKVLAGRIRQICNHGSEVRYYHDILGVNSRLDALQAAVLRIKLRHLNEYASDRNRAATAYDQAFAGHSHLRTPVRTGHSDHVFHQYTLRVAGGHRDGLKKHLEAHGVPAMVYYPVPLHLQKAYATRRCGKGDLPVSETLAAEVLSLPMHTELDAGQLAHITGAVLSYFGNIHPDPPTHNHSDHP